MSTEERRAELLGAAVAEDLQPGEQAELDALLAGDPTARAELAELRESAALMGALGGTWDEPELPAGLAGRVRATTVEAEPVPEPGELASASASGSGPAAPVARRRSWLLAAAAACVAAGVAGTLALQAVADAPVAGPPGTLGAVEEIDFRGEPAGVVVEAALVAHTWGTETVLDIDGLTVGASYAVVVVAGDGTELDSGTFLGSEVPVVCRMNAALLREEVVRVEIRDAAGGVVMAADAPPARG